MAPVIILSFMRRYFTVDEANRTLPLVRRIVEDIVTEYRRWKEQLYRYELAAARDRAEGGESSDAERLRREVEVIAHRINGYIEELAPVGCTLKGFEEGLVDFRSRLDGRDILLCWKLGEREVAHWHEMDAGYAGRQPLQPEPIRGRQP